MIIAGGVYLETCLRPEWRRLFGSGLRAACAVSRLSPGTELHAYCSQAWADDVRYTATAFGCTAHVRPIQDSISFSYDHPLSLPHRHPSIVTASPAIVVQGP